MLLLVFAATYARAADGKGEVGVGEKAVLTDVQLLDVSGKKVTLNDVKKENGVLVLFSCNTCPFVKGWEGRYPEIKSMADKHDVGMIVLNSNYGKRDAGDSYADMQARAKEQGYNFYYAVDKDSRLANAFGGKTTPHAFLFDSDMKLVYKGAVDDNYKNANDVKNAYLKNAIVSLGNGDDVAISETEPVGCSIKRKLD